MGDKDDTLMIKCYLKPCPNSYASSDSFLMPRPSTISFGLSRLIYAIFHLERETQHYQTGGVEKIFLRRSKIWIFRIASYCNLPKRQSPSLFYHKNKGHLRKFCLPFFVYSLVHQSFSTRDHYRLKKIIMGHGDVFSHFIFSCFYPTLFRTPYM